MKNSPASLTRNVTTNWVYLVLGIIYALLITPVVVHSMMTEAYGAWSNLNGFLAYSELFYMGLGVAIIRYVAEAKAENDDARISRLTSTILSIYLVLGTICFLIFVFLSGHVEKLFAGGLPDDLVRPAMYACILVGARVFFVFIGSSFSGLLSGHDRFDLVNAVFIATAILRLIVIPIVILRTDQPLLMLALVTTSVTFVEAFVLAGIAYWYVPSLRIRLVRPTWSELKLLYGFGLPSFLVLTAFKLISSTDLFVISALLGATAAGLYSPPLMLVENARLCVAGFSGVLLPRLTVMTTRSDHASMQQAYLSATRIGCFIAGWVGAGIIALGPTFLKLWLGEEFSVSAGPVLFWLAIAAFAAAVSTQTSYPFYQASGIMMLPAAVLIAEGAINLGLSIWLAPTYGIAGVAFATAVPAVLLTPLILPRILCRRLGVSLGTFFMKSVLPGLAMLVLTLAVEALVGLAVGRPTYAELIARGALTIPIAFAVLQLTFPVDERNQIRRMLGLRAG